MLGWACFSSSGWLSKGMMDFLSNVQKSFAGGVTNIRYVYISITVEYKFFDGFGGRMQGSPFERNYHLGICLYQGSTKISTLIHSCPSSPTRFTSKTLCQHCVMILAKPMNGGGAEMLQLLGSTWMLRLMNLEWHLKCAQGCVYKYLQENMSVNLGKKYVYTQCIPNQII